MAAAFLNCLSEQRNAHDRAHHSFGASYVRDKRPRGIVLFCQVQPRLRDTRVAFEAAESESDWLLDAAKSEPSDIARVISISEQCANAINRNNHSADSSDSQQPSNRRGQADDLSVGAETRNFGYA